MGQFRGNNMGAIGQAFNRARQAQQSQQPRSGGKFNRPQQPQQQGSGALANMMNRARQQQQMQQRGTRGPAPTQPRMSTGLQAPMKQPAQNQPIKSRNQTYGRMLSAPMRGRGRGRF